MLTTPDEPQNTDTAARNPAVSERKADHIALPSGVEMHPNFYDLLNETHARTAAGVGAPCLVSHLVFLSEESSHASDRESVQAFSEIDGHRIIEFEANHAQIETPTGTLKWQRHTEFSSYTLFEEAATDGLKEKTINDLLSDGWPVSGAGKLLLALKIHVDSGEEMHWWRDWEKRPNHEPSGCLSHINGGRAILRTNFMPGA
ncbi:MAG: DUF3422 family protein, partial [Pseudomonadota bacterium]